MRATLIAVFALAGVAHADSQGDGAFRRWALARAKRLQRSVASWGTVQLDDESGLERFAELCDDEGLTILFGKDPSARWSTSVETLGRGDACPAYDAHAKQPRWKALDRRGFAVTIGYHHGSEELHLGVRHGALELVGIEETEMDLPRACTRRAADFDTLVGTESHCIDLQHWKDDTNPRWSTPTHGAVFFLDGESGSYRARTGSVALPTLDVAARSAGKRAAITTTLSRPSLVGESVEVWTVTSAGQAMAWVQRWDGSAWKQSTAGHAPHELPGTSGDSAHLTVPVVLRDEREGTPLCVVWRAVPGDAYVATCDLDVKNPASFGVLFAKSRLVPAEYKIER
jgi:hypothetical protein